MAEQNLPETRGDVVLSATVDLLKAHLARTEVDPDRLPELVSRVGTELSRLSQQGLSEHAAADAAMKTETKGGSAPAGASQASPAPETTAPETTAREISAPESSAQESASPARSASERAQPAKTTARTDTSAPTERPADEPVQPGDPRPDWMPEGTTGKQRPPWSPAVPINESVADSYIICLEDGEKVQVLKRHLKTRYNMTVQQYRSKWSLPSSYPKTAPQYQRLRSEIAKKSGAGFKPGQNTPATGTTATSEVKTSAKTPTKATGSKTGAGKSGVQKTGGQKAGGKKSGTKQPSDDLTAIKGVGAHMQDQLAELGIRTYKQLADADAATVAEHLKSTNFLMSEKRVRGWQDEAQRLNEMGPSVAAA